MESRDADIRLTFYQLLQLDAHGLWARIHAASDGREKARYAAAMAVRSVLLVAFAILFIGVLGGVFGQENSGLVVAGFCVLLGIKFVPYGYHIGDSLLALALTFALMVAGGVVALADSPALGLAANFAFVALILVMVANDPPMGNAGVYVFGYLFVSQTPVSGDALAARIVLAAVLVALCGAVLYHKHRAKFADVRLAHLFRDFSLDDEKCLWQLRLAAGVAGAIWIGGLLGLPRDVWVGYACMSVLLPYEEDRAGLRHRGAQRIGGVVVGSLLFNLFAAIVPPQAQVLFGPLAGICIGFSKKYFWNNVLNCFGALLLATSVYGLTGSVALRIVDNLVGVLFALAFVAILTFLEDHVRAARGRTAA